MSELLALGGAGLQAAILGTLAAALRRRNVSAAVNALVAFGATLVPTAVAVGLLAPGPAGGAGVEPELRFWIAAAGFLHSLGMLGLYESVWWWDHLTHALSAALVAALVYAGLVVVARQSADLGASVVGVTLLFTFAAGVFWELGELVARDVAERFDVDPVLVFYGWRDTALDLVFDLVGALVVVVLDVRVFVPLADQFPGATRTLLVWSGGVVVVGSLLMAVGVGLGGSGRPRAE